MKIYSRHAGRRGTALILIIGLLAILAILGTTMLTTARIDRKANMASDISAGAQIASRGILRQLCQMMKDDLYISEITTGCGVYAPYASTRYFTAGEKWRRFIDRPADDIDMWLGESAATNWNTKYYGFDIDSARIPSMQPKVTIHPTNLFNKQYTAAQKSTLNMLSMMLADTDCIVDYHYLNGYEALIFDTNIMNDNGDRYFAAVNVFDLSSLPNMNTRNSAYGDGGQSGSASCGYFAICNNYPPVNPSWMYQWGAQDPIKKPVWNATPTATPTMAQCYTMYKDLSLRPFNPNNPSAPTWLYAPWDLTDCNMRQLFWNSYTQFGRYNDRVNSCQNGTAYNCTRSLMRYPNSDVYGLDCRYKMPLYGLTTDNGQPTGNVTNIIVPDPTNMAGEVLYGSWANHLTALYARMKYFFKEMGIQDAQKRAAYFCANYQLYRSRTQPKNVLAVQPSWYTDPYVAGTYSSWTSPDGDAVNVVWEQPYISEACAAALPQWPDTGSGAHTGAWIYAIEVYNPYYRTAAGVGTYTFDVYKGAAKLNGAAISITAGQRIVLFDFGGYIDGTGAGTLAVANDFSLTPSGTVVQLPGISFADNTPIRLVRSTGTQIQLDSVKISEFAAAPNNGGLAAGTGATGYLLEGLRDDACGVTVTGCPDAAYMPDRRRVCLPVYAWRLYTDSALNMKNLIKQHNLGFQNISQTAGENGIDYPKGVQDVTGSESKQISVGDSSKPIHNFQTNTASTAGDKQEFQSALWGSPVIMGMAPWNLSMDNNVWDGMGWVTTAFNTYMKYGNLAELNEIWLTGPTTDQDLPHRLRDEYTDTPGRGMLDPAPYKRMNLNYDTGSTNANGDRVYAAQTGQGGWTSSLEATRVYPDVPIGALVAEFFEYVPTDKWRKDGEDYRNYGKVNINSSPVSSLLLQMPWLGGYIREYQPFPYNQYQSGGVTQPAYYDRTTYAQVGTAKRPIKPYSFISHLYAYVEKRAPKDYLTRAQLGPMYPGFNNPGAGAPATPANVLANMPKNISWGAYNYWAGWDTPEVTARSYYTSRSDLTQGGSDIKYLRDASNYEGFLTPGEIAIPLNDYFMSLFASESTGPYWASGGSSTSITCPTLPPKPAGYYDGVGCFATDTATIPLRGIYFVVKGYAANSTTLPLLFPLAAPVNATTIAVFAVTVPAANDRFYLCVGGVNGATGPTYNAQCTRHNEPHNYGSAGWIWCQSADYYNSPLMDANTDVPWDIANAVGNDPYYNAPNPRAKLVPYWATFAYAETDVPQAVIDGIGTYYNWYCTSHPNFRAHNRDNCQFCGNNNNVVTTTCYNDFYSVRTALTAGAINLITVNSDTYAVNMSISRAPYSYAFSTGGEITHTMYTTGTGTAIPGPGMFSRWTISLPQCGSGYAAQTAVVLSGVNAGFNRVSGDGGGEIRYECGTGYNPGDNNSCIFGQDYAHTGFNTEAAFCSEMMAWGKKTYVAYGSSGDLTVPDPQTLPNGLVQYHSPWGERFVKPGFNANMGGQMLQLLQDNWNFMGVIDRSTCRKAEDMPAVLMFTQIR